MPRLSLPQVTLCAIDTRCPGLALESLQRSRALVDFGRSVLFTHGAALAGADGIEIAASGAIDSGAAYSHFVLRRLPALIDTPFVLVTQWDGFVLDAAAWNDDFLDCDYVGAVWDDQPTSLSVGNGGFSLRSQRLLQAGLDPRIADEHPEDAALCRTHRALLERDHGVRFAPRRLAARFAHENVAPRAATFGFHGPKNLAAVLDAETLARWLDTLPDDFFRGRDARRLARALLRARQPQLVLDLLQRRQRAGRVDPKTRSIAWRARLQLALSRLVG